MENSRKTLVVGCVVGFLLLMVLGIVVAVFLVARSVPTADQLPLNATPIMVTLASPLNDAHYPVNSYIPVRVKAFGRESLFTLELWVDGALIETQEVQPDSSGKAGVEWQWVPAGQGEHILLARAMTPGGLVSTSNLVRVTATEPVGASVEIVAEEGDTLADIAEQYQVPPEDVQAKNPDLDPSAPLPPGQPVLIPISPAPLPSAAKYVPPVAPGGAAETVTGVDPSTISLAGSAGSLPAVPVLAVEASGCDVNLFITDQAEGEKGFFVYRGGAGGASLQRIATLPANDGPLPLKFVDPGRQGQAVYAVAAFNAAGEAQSNPVSVTISDPACSPAQGAPGGLQWVDGKLILPQEVNAAYFYFSRGGKVWQRVPSGEGFLVPVENSLAIDPALAQFAAATGGASGDLMVEVWGWQDGALVYLGAAQQIAPPSYPTDLHVCSQVGECKQGLGWTAELTLDWDGDMKRQFFWRTDAQGVNKAVWQISETPFPLSPVLLDSAFTQEEAVAYNGGFFWIDFGEFRDGGTSAASPATAPPATSTPSSSGTGFPFLTFDFYPSAMFLLPGTYYVRLIPMAGNQAVALPSNVVKIHVGPPQEPPDITIYEVETYYDVHILEFRPIHWPEPGVCAFILENDCAVPLPFGGTKVIPAGTSICPESYKGKGEKAWYESLWDFVKDGLSWLSNLYEDIKQGVVDAVGGVVCGGDETCKDVLMAGLNAGLAAMGIPPSIPNLDELMAQGITYIAAEVATEMTGTEYLDDLYKEAADLGIPEDKAKAFVRDRVQDLVQEGLEAQAAANPNPACMPAEQAHAMGFEPVCGLPPECRVKDDPRAQRLPATLQVEVTRSTERGAGATEEEMEKYFQHYLKITFWVQDNANPVGDVIFLNDWEQNVLPITEPLSGKLFETIVIPVPALAPGESIVIPFTPEPTDYWVPGHQEALNGWSYAECDDYGCRSLTWDDWWKLYYRGEATITARVGRICPYNYEDADRLCKYSTEVCVAGPLPTSIEPFQVYCTK
jgi:LysM repeat protein